METPTSDTASEISSTAPGHNRTVSDVSGAPPSSVYAPVTPPNAALLFVRVASGVTRVNLATFYFAVFITIACYTFVNGSALQLVLSEIIKVPADQTGSYTGDLGFYSELVIVAACAPMGVLSDKIGRKAVYIIAFSCISLGFYLMSYATSFGILVLYRLIYAVGAAAAAAMLTSVLADYVYYPDKGRGSGFMGLFSGGGALLSALLLVRIPEWLSYLGEIQAIHATYLITASIVLAANVALFFGLQGMTAVQRENKETMPWLLVGEGFKAAWNDAELALSFASGFVARGDSVVLITFLSLWVSDYVKSQGGAPDEAAAEAGKITGIAQTCALVFALIAGYMASRLRGVLALVIVALIATVGYGAMCFIVDPTSSGGIVCACVIGIGEIGVIVTAQSLASRRAPTHLRGSIGGLVGLCGSVGILVCTKVGGLLYDEWSPVGPFALFAGFNALLFVWALAVYIVRWRSGKAFEDVAPQEDLETYERLLQVGKTSEDTAAAIMRAGSYSY